MTTKNITLLLFLLLLTGGASKATTIDITVASTEDRTVSGFTAIDNGGAYNVIVTMGGTEKVRLEGNEEAIAEVITEVRGGKLLIHNKSKWNNWSGRRPNFGKVTIYVTAKSLNGLSVSGSGDMKVEQLVRSQNLTADVSGSGSLKISAEVNSLTSKLSGSGEIYLSGKADRCSLRISGSGNISAKELDTQETDAHISGSGNISIKARKHLDASISGSGNITYSGEADVSKSKSGSGSIRKVSF